MKAIAAVDQNWAIGNKGELLVHLAPDLKRFRELTTGKVVICGRKTLDGFPGGKPLKNRLNIILTGNPAFRAEGAVIAHSVEEVLEQCRMVPNEDIFVIGGGTVYRQMLKYCTEALITKAEAEYEADTWFPDLDQDPEWNLTEQGEVQEYDGIRFHFDRYVRV